MSSFPVKFRQDLHLCADCSGSLAAIKKCVSLPGGSAPFNRFFCPCRLLAPGQKESRKAVPLPLREAHRFPAMYHSRLYYFIILFHEIPTHKDQGSLCQSVSHEPSSSHKDHDQADHRSSQKHEPKSDLTIIPGLCSRCARWRGRTG